MKKNNEEIYIIEFKENRFCIITRESSENIKEIHNREPLIINKDHIADFLNVEKEGMNLLNNMKLPDLKFHEVSKDVNNPTNNNFTLVNAIT